MSVDHSLDPLYTNARCVVWVEDPFTQVYLGALWNDQDFVFPVVGNQQAVQSMVRRAAALGFPNVFGVVDRDFARFNPSTWNKPDQRVFRLSRHEIENYCLDPSAIAECLLNTIGRSQQDIETRLQELLASQVPWLAYRRVLHEMEEELLRDFPGQSNSAQLPSISDAERAILSSTWYAAIRVRTNAWDAPRVRTSLVAVVRELQAALVNGTWVNDFSGKEIFRPLRGFVYAPTKAGDHDADFARSIAERQRVNNAAVSELTALHQILRQRCGLP
jgi:hypothetical protein